MSRILLAAEFGGAYGHVSRLLPLGRALAARGHEVVFVLRDMLVGEVIVGPHGFPVLQAPTDGGPPPGGGRVATYPALLRLRGYYRREGVAGMLKAWLHLLDQLRPDLVIADFSPTATLAARLRGVRAVALGCGYYCPPRRVPMPILPTIEGEASHWHAVEQLVLANINHAVAGLGAAPFATFAEFLPPVADILTTFPEIDPYGGRLDEVYWGAIQESFGTASPTWPSGSGPRILAYLVAIYPALPKLMADLGRLGLPTLIHLRGLSDSRMPALPANVILSEEALDIDEALADASLLISHASHGICTKALLAGVPMVMLPSQAEQAVVAHRLAANKLGLAGPSTADRRFDHAALVERALGDPALAVATTDFAARYARFDPEAAVARIAGACEAMAGA